MASTQRFVRDGFVLTVEDLTNVAGLFRKLVGEPTFDVECTDHVSRDFSSLDQLLVFPNSRSKRIQSLRITAASPDSRTRASLTFSTGHSPLHVSADGPEEAVSRFSEEVNDSLEGMRPWYSFLAKRDFVNLGFLIVGTILVAAIVAIALGFVKTPPPSPATSDPRAEATAYAVMIGGMAVVLIGAILLNRVRDRLFPLATFALGQGVERYRRAELWRWTVVIGFLVSVAASVTMKVFGV